MIEKKLARGFHADNRDVNCHLVGLGDHIPTKVLRSFP